MSSSSSMFTYRSRSIYLVFPFLISIFIYFTIRTSSLFSPIMKAAILVRTNSITSHPQPHHHIPSPSTADKPSAPFRRSRSIKASFNLKTNPIRRSSSDTSLSISNNPIRSPASAKWVPPATDVAEDTAAEAAETYSTPSDLWRYTTDVTTGVSPVSEEVDLTGGGIGKGRKFGGGSGGGYNETGGGDLALGDYYKKMLKTDPGNSLLLRNYGKFLHEVGDVKGAEECYGRAILASPGDGEVLAMYGGLVWEAHRDGDRAGDYFRRAVESAPDDCYVLGSYASFLWDTDEDEEECIVAPLPAMVKAF